MQEAGTRLYDVETRLTSETLELFKKIAAANHRSVAAELRVAVERHIDAESREAAA